MAKQERIYLMAITIEKGIITLIEEEGNIGYYRQRGIQRINPTIRALLIQRGFLDKRWQTVPELPRNYSIYYEEPDIQGRAVATYPDPNRMLQGLGSNRR